MLSGSRMAGTTPARALKLLSILALLTLGSHAHAEPRLLDPLPADEIAKRMTELQEIPYSGAATLVEDGDAGDCSRKKLTLQVGDALSMQAQPLTLTLIQPQNDKPVPVIIVVPTILGVTAVENKLASNFCDMGFATIIADVNDTSFPKVLPSWGHEDLTNRHAILAIRTAIDFATTNNTQFDPARIGLLGSSLGAVQSAFLAGLESTRLAGIMLVVGGSNLPGIMSTSDDKDVEAFREARMENSKMTSVDQYEDKLRATVRYDSSYFASLAKTDHIFMVMSDNDTKVPTPYQEQMFAQFGKPSSTTFTLSHVQTIISLTYWYFDYVSDFFSQRFGLKATKHVHTHTVITEARPYSSAHPLPTGL